jgi:hypothetical protein
MTGGPKYVRLRVEVPRKHGGEHRIALRDLAPNGIYRVTAVAEDDGERSYYLRGAPAFYSDYLFEEVSE